MEIKNPKPQEPALPHHLALDECERLTATGVREILRFDEQSVLLRTDKRLLLIRGRQIRLRQLAPDSGRVEVLGSIQSLSYESAPARRGWFRR